MNLLITLNGNFFYIDEMDTTFVEGEVIVFDGFENRYINFSSLVNISEGGCFLFEDDI